MRAHPALHECHTYTSQKKKIRQLSECFIAELSDSKSGKRDSNSRPQPWQGCALPTELFPHLSFYDFSEEEETRTPTTQLSLPPQSSASTNSATSPLLFALSFLHPLNNPTIEQGRQGAQNRTRTCTSLLTLVPETSASTIPPPEQKTLLLIYI